MPKRASYNPTNAGVHIASNTLTCFSARLGLLPLLSDQCLAHPVDRQGALLLLGLDRNKAHARPLDRFADRLGVGPVVLVAFDIRLDLLRRHQTHRVAEPGDLSRPEM